MAVHAALSVEEYGNPAELADRLGIPVARIKMILTSLKQMGLAAERGGKWLMLNKDLHLPAGHCMNQVSHRNWRDRACVDVERDRATSVHYTSVFAMSRSDAEKLRAMTLEMIESSRALIKPSPSEVVYCLLYDFFEV